MAVNRKSRKKQFSDCAGSRLAVEFPGYKRDSACGGGIGRRVKPEKGTPVGTKGSSLLIERLVSLVQEEIDRTAAGEQLPSEVELAERYGVARKSIRAAMAVLEADGAVQRVRGKGTFPTRGRQAGPLFRPEARRIGLVNWFGIIEAGEEKGFYARLLEGALGEVTDRNGELVLAGGRSKEAKAEACYRLCDDTHVDGLLLVAVINQDLLAELATRGKPLCLVDHHSEKARIDSIRFDSRRTSELAVEHLFHLGHRRIACMQPEKAEINPERFEGYKRALDTFGLDYRAELVVDVPSSAPGGARGAERLLALPAPQRPTAIVAFATDMASGAIQAITRFGLRVPEDISVVAGGAVRSPLSPDLPELTTVQVNAADLGRKAVERLWQRIESPDMEAEEIILPVELHLGKSSGAGPDKSNAQRTVT